jgi:hypothetical protein
VISAKITVFWEVMPYRLLDIYPTTWCHIPEGYCHYHENIKSEKKFVAKNVEMPELFILKIFLFRYESGST